MAELDIRDVDEVVIDTIRVSEPSHAEYLGDVLFKNHYEDVMLKDSADGRSLTIGSKEHAENLIKGLQKAIDLDWFN